MLPEGASDHRSDVPVGRGDCRSEVLAGRGDYQSDVPASHRDHTQDSAAPHGLPTPQRIVPLGPVVVRRGRRRPREYPDTPPGRLAPRGPQAARLAMDGRPQARYICFRRAPPGA